MSVHSRRRFLADAGAALTFAVVRPEVVRGSRASTRVDLGIIGCGGRGSWIANLFQKHGGYNVVAAADYFPDRVRKFGDKLGVPQARRFTGLSAYRRLLEHKLDAVAIMSPPFFHPTQAADAVAAGTHVYLAKPIAVDVPGCTMVQEAAAKAMGIYWKDTIDCPIIQWLHRIPYNQTYWTNWPTAANPALGTNGAFWAETGMLVITSLKKAE